MTTSAGVVPRLLRQGESVAQEWIGRFKWSPNDVLQEFDPATMLAVKRSAERFFMYEEMEGAKLADQQGPTQVLNKSPLELANMLEQPEQHKDESSPASVNKPYYYYWTSPVSAVAPATFSKQRLEGYPTLLDPQRQRYMDPRGPSLWIGSSGSATQAHYDVADNVLVQLHGTKRIRCFPPSAATALYVFPDAHPRARKSQVNLDHPDLEKFPLYSQQPPTAVLDILLQPGDALEIPAFWFHHVENGRLPASNNHTHDFADGPSVSLNLFSLSQPMLTAQDIFQTASQPIPGGVSPEQVVPILHALGFGLMELVLELQDSASLSSKDVIQTCLLDARYKPLNQDNSEATNPFLEDSASTPEISSTQRQQIQQCLDRIRPLLDQLWRQSSSHDNGCNGIPLLVALHLLELWAVQMVGPNQVASVWEAVVQFKDA